MKLWLETYAHEGTVELAAIPRIGYAELYAELQEKLAMEQYHVASYFGCPVTDGLLFVCILLDDLTHKVFISSYLHASHGYKEILPSLTAHFPAMHSFEREIAENYGVCFAENPWNKPLRFAHDRANRSKTINNYPFYSIEGEALHEVNVGPIHAGIIEPGCFRFICNGEEVLHLEIVLGYQHRGIESVLRKTDDCLRQNLLCETIAGDTTVGHALAFVENLERLAGSSGEVTALAMQRVVALELERIAMHIADCGALCTDIGYQLGQVACEALRTLVINSTQYWCGNRFGKGLIRPFGTFYPLDERAVGYLLPQLNEVERRFREVAGDLENSSSVLSRMEDTGRLTRAQADRIGAVGMAARASGLTRDVRLTHPTGVYRDLLIHHPETMTCGDVFGRMMVRIKEVFQSIAYLRELVEKADFTEIPGLPVYDTALRPSTLAFSLVEGWRGEICHAAITDAAGVIAHYKIKDPSQQNWLGLALSVRGGGISDFPICNKSFNLSYCGHDL